MTIHAIQNGLGNQHGDSLILQGQGFLVGTAPPAQVTRTGYSTYEYTLGDDSVLGPLSIPNIWAPGTVISCWARYLINEAYAVNDGNVKFQIVYEAVETDGTQAIGAGAGATIASADDAIPAVALSPKEVQVGTILAANLAAADSIGIIFSRIALTGGGNDPAAEEPGVMSLHFRTAVNHLVPQLT